MRSNKNYRTAAQNLNKAWVGIVTGDEELEVIDGHLDRALEAIEELERTEAWYDEDEVDEAAELVDAFGEVYSALKKAYSILSDAFVYMEEIRIYFPRTFETFDKEG